MNEEFHYWVTGLIAEYAGFTGPQCRTIAYSSQYTDDNNCKLEVFDSAADTLPSYVSHVSQTEDITKPQKEIMTIYPLFHFVPGDKAAQSPRKDSRSHPLLTTPGSSYANKIMEYTLQNGVSSLREKDYTSLHRLGIAAHCYADTWSHQNFIGWFDDMNGLPAVPLPNIGHLDALHDPDLVNHRWKDKRLVNESVRNNDRFIVAAEELYGHFRWFCDQIGQSAIGPWQQLRDFLISAWEDSTLDSSARMKRYKKHSKHLRDYNPDRWTSEAFVIEYVPMPGLENQKVAKRVWKEGPRKNKDWYRFQEAVKAHIADASAILRPAFLEAGIYI